MLLVAFSKYTNRGFDDGSPSFCPREEMKREEESDWGKEEGLTEAGRRKGEKKNVETEKEKEKME